MAEEDLFGLTPADVRKLKRLLEIVDTGGWQLEPWRTKRPLPSAERVLFGVLTSPVIGTSALIPTAATVGTLNVYRASSTGFVDTGIDETVYNLAIQDATTDRISICGRDNVSGKLILITQFCS